jgi:hypothetical protein
VPTQCAYVKITRNRDDLPPGGRYGDVVFPVRYELIVHGFVESYKDTESGTVCRSVCLDADLRPSLPCDATVVLVTWRPLVLPSVSRLGMALSLLVSDVSLR